MAERTRAPDALQLLARDEEDLAVLSMVLQDALVAVAEMAYLPDEQRFVLVANRFRWEPPVDGPRKNFERRHTGLSIDGVTDVKRRGFSLAEPDRILVLLAILPVPGGAVSSISPACLDPAGNRRDRLPSGRSRRALADPLAAATSPGELGT